MYILLAANSPASWNGAVGLLNFDRFRVRDGPGGLRHGLT